MRIKLLMMHNCKCININYLTHWFPYSTNEELKLYFIQHSCPSGVILKCIP